MSRGLGDVYKRQISYKAVLSYFCDTIYCVCLIFVTLHTAFVTKIRQYFFIKNQQKRH
ncbi:hypothetical protein JMUB7535_26760 [Staphylococcus aureus]